MHSHHKVNMQVNGNQSLPDHLASAVVLWLNWWSAIKPGDTSVVLEAQSVREDAVAIANMQHPSCFRNGACDGLAQHCPMKVSCDSLTNLLPDQSNSPTRNYLHHILQHV